MPAVPSISVGLLVRADLYFNKLDINVLLDAGTNRRGLHPKEAAGTVRATVTRSIGYG